MFWNVKEIDAPQLARLLGQKEKGVRVIDVRGMGEIAAGTVPGAEPVPLHTLPLKVRELRRDETLVFVCRSGARSAQACAFLSQHGFENIFNLRGGMMAWVQNGLPAAAPAPA
jgi:rhodanese-related sulfurtransferase